MNARRRTMRFALSAFLFCVAWIMPVAAAPGSMMDACMIIRDKETKAASLVIQENGPWRLYAGPRPFAVDLERPVLDGDAPGRYPVRVDPGTRSYFVVALNDRAVPLAERLLPMAGGWNFRDLGGIPAGDGRRTAWGKLIRADGLNGLSDADLAYLASVPLTTIADFRNEHEAAKSPDRIPPSVKRHLHLAITPGRLEAGNPKAIFASPAGDEFMEEMNRTLALDPRIQAVYREFFSKVQHEENLPLLFHCSAGKDRTGFAAALILLSLGVDREAVLADYMASERHLAGKYDDLMTRYPDHAALFMVKPSYLEAALDAIDERYGSVERYMREALDVDIEKMKALFLE